MRNSRIDGYIIFSAFHQPDLVVLLLLTGMFMWAASYASSTDAPSAAGTPPLGQILSRIVTFQVFKIRWLHGLQYGLDVTNSNLSLSSFATERPTFTLVTNKYRCGRITCLRLFVPFQDQNALRDVIDIR